jgi:hypothetical protein
MARVSKSARIQLWLDRLNRFSLGDQSVAVFCSSEGVSAPSFYQWRRRLTPTVELPQTSTQRAKGDSNFTELSVASPSSAATTIRLPGSIAIELGSEQETVTSVVAQVLNHCLPRTECATTSKDTSC